MAQEIYKALLFMLLGASLLMLYEARSDIEEMRNQVHDDSQYVEAWMSATKAACAAKGVEVPPLRGEEQ